MGRRYLVLVGGVAQVALGAGQALLAPRLPSRRLVAAEFAGWNAGNAAVLIGTLAGVAPLVDAGGALLVAALALLVHGTRGARGHRSWPLHAFRLLAAVLLVSIPVGLLLAGTGPA